MRAGKSTWLMNGNVLINPHEVNNRLEAFGLTREDFLKVIEAGVGGRRSCTKNDPPSAASWMSWKEGTREAREIAAPKGYERDEADGISGIYSPNRAIRIVVSNTDDGTGVIDGFPQQRSRKGAGTDHLVYSNQRTLFE